MRHASTRAVLALTGAIAAMLVSGSAAQAATTCPATSSAYAQAVAGTAGLVGYWRLGDASGTPACDSLGQNPGAYSGAVTLGQPGAIAGDADTSAAFDGSSGTMSVPASTSLNVGDSFTIEAWVKRRTLGGSAYQVIASKQSSAWVLAFDQVNELVLRQSGVDDVAYSNVALTDTSSWHHVVATKSGTSI